MAIIEIRQRQYRGEGDGFGTGRNRRQAEPGSDFAVMGDTVAGNEGVLRAQPDRETEGGGVLHGVQQHIGIGERHIGVGEGDAAGVVQFRHLCQQARME